MKNIMTFVILAIALVGLVGGIGYTIYSGAYPIAVGVAALGYLAYPKAKEMFKGLFNDNDE
ncbi:MAG: hypothetical protein IKP66_01130 [Lachnospiraceae bacterium]|nr:hypothetical protein [Lachnospiraceae bacterium]